MPRLKIHLLEHIIAKHPLLKTQHLLQIPLRWRLTAWTPGSLASAMVFTLSREFAATVSALGFRIDSNIRMLFRISLISLLDPDIPPGLRRPRYPLRLLALQRATLRVLRRP